MFSEVIRRAAQSALEKKVLDILEIQRLKPDSSKLLVEVSVHVSMRNDGYMAYVTIFTDRISHPITLTKLNALLRVLGAQDIAFDPLGDAGGSLGMLLAIKGIPFDFAD
jgi:hypothetical protein